MPGCLLLHFAAADLNEVGGDVAGARQIFEELISGFEASTSGVHRVLNANYIASYFPRESVLMHAVRFVQSRSSF